MSQLKLTYFDMHGGRGEPARLAMAIGGIDFEDSRFAFAEFAEVRGMDDIFFEHSVQYENHLALLFPIRDSYPGKF